MTEHAIERLVREAGHTSKLLRHLPLKGSPKLTVPQHHLEDSNAATPVIRSTLGSAAAR